MSPSLDLDPANQVAQKIGNFFQPAVSFGENALKNPNSPVNLSTIGSVGGGILGGIGGTFAAPFTAGIVNPVTGAMAGAAAGGAGGESLREKMNGENQNGGSIIAQGALGGLSDGFGQALGAGVKAIAPLASRGLANAADDLVTGSLGLTPGAGKTFYKATGGADGGGKNLNEFMNEQGLLQKVAGSDNPAQVVSNAKADLQNQYDGIARNSGLQVPSSTVKNNILNELIPLTGQNSTSADKAAAERIWNEYKQLDLPSDGTMSIKDIANLKAKYQGQTNYGPTGNAADNSVNGTISSAFKKTVDQAADQANLTGPNGQSLSTMGNNLHQFHILNDMVQANANATTSKKIPLIGTAVKAIAPLLAGGLGASTFGVGGAAAGIGLGLAGNAIANSPKVIAGEAAAMAKGSTAIGSLVSKAPAISEIASVPGKMAAPVLGNALNTINKPVAPMPNTAPSPSPSSAPGAVPSLTPTQPDNSQWQPGQAMSAQQAFQLKSEDLATTGGKFMDKIQGIYDSQNPDQVAGLSNAIGAAQNLKTLFDASGGGVGGIASSLQDVQSKIGGALGSNLGSSARSYDSGSDALMQEITNQAYKGGLDVGSIGQINKLKPLRSDPPATAQQKVSLILSILSQKNLSNTSATNVTNQQGLSSMKASPSLNLNQ